MAFNTRLSSSKDSSTKKRIVSGVERMTLGRFSRCDLKNLEELRGFYNTFLVFVLSLSLPLLSVHVLGFYVYES